MKRKNRFPSEMTNKKASAEKQIPCGNDNQKCNGNGKGEQQIPFGNDKQKSKCNSKDRSRFPSGMTNILRG